MGLFSSLFKNREIKDDVNQKENIVTNGSFHFVVDDVFTIMGKGTVVTGRVLSGEIHIGDIVNIAGRTTTEVTGIEMFRKTLEYAKEGDNCGILLKDISRDQISRGDVITK